MVKYLIVQLDDTSASFCHYPNTRTERKLIPIETLKKALFWGMKENVIFQFLYPDYELPEEYKIAIETVYRADILPSECKDNSLSEEADVMILESIKDAEKQEYKKEAAHLVRATFTELFANIETLKTLLAKVDRLTVVPTDVENYKDSMNDEYSSLLASLAEAVKQEYAKGHSVQLNLLTDRLLLDKMNNCNAGWESITLAPDGKYYVCPAFYLCEDGYPVGDVENGPDIKNPQLYRLSHAPICRNCDAWQCKRCIWLNRKMTLEVNTPSHEQCVIAHLERNASARLLSSIRELGKFLPDKELHEDPCLDPFDKVEQ